MTPDTRNLADLHHQGIIRFMEGLPPAERPQAAERLMRALNLYLGKPIAVKTLPLDSSGDPDPTKKPAPATPIPTFP